MSATQYDIVSAIQIFATDYTTASDASVGLIDGVYYWSFGYDETDYWNGATAGILTDFGGVSRSVDISETGGLFSEGSAEFTAHNGSGLASSFEAYGIDPIGCRVRIQMGTRADPQMIFTGLVTSYSVSETEVNFSCSVEGLIPTEDVSPQVITAEAFPDAPEGSIGKPFPVILGDVQYSPCVLTSLAGAKRWGPFLLYVTADNFSTDGTMTLQFVVFGVDQPSAEAGNWVSFADSPNGNSAAYRICEATHVPLGYDIGLTWTLKIQGYIDDYASHSFASMASASVGAWFFYVTESQAQAKASAYALSSVPDLSDKDSVSFYLEDLGGYTQRKGATTFLDGNCDVAIQASPRPESTTDSTIFGTRAFGGHGETFEITSANPESWDEQIFVDGDIFSRESDDQKFCIEFTQTSAGPEYNHVFSLIISNITKDTIGEDSDSLFIAPSFSVDPMPASGAAQPARRIWTAYVARYGSSYTVIDDQPATIGTIYPVNYTPVDFWESGDIPTKDRAYNLASNTDDSVFYAIPEEIVKGLQSGLFTSATCTMKWEADYTGTGPGFQYLLNFNSVCIAYGFTTLASDATPYISTTGEKYATYATNTIAVAQNRIIDGAITTIGPSTDTGAWHIGATITEQKAKDEALSDLFKQAFVAASVDGLGMLRVRAWIDDVLGSEPATPSVAFGPTNILRDSISGYGKTSLDKCYTGFTAQYGRDYETDEYTGKIAVLKATESAFPAIDGAWDSFVSGVGYSTTDTDLYDACKALWDACHAGYVATRTPRMMPDGEGELYYYSDASWLGTDVAKYDLSAFKWLQRAAYWMTRQKQEITFKVSLQTALEECIEVLDYCSFSDPIYTLGATLNGWITSLSYSLEDCEVTMMFAPTDNEICIVETGSADDTITESGAWTDTYTEGA